MTHNLENRLRFRNTNILKYLLQKQHYETEHLIRLNKETL